MKKVKAVSIQPAVTAPAFSRTVLDDAPIAAFHFLRAASLENILRELKKVGYTQEDHTEGWTLFYRTGGYRLTDAAKAPNESIEAIREIEAWMGPNLTRARAVLQRRFADAYDFVFGGLEIGNKQEAMITVSTFLARLDDLESSAERKASRKSDHAALEALASRGITADVRRHMAALIVKSQKQPELTASEAPSSAAERDAALANLYLWVREWRETARTVIKNRSMLIQLGIGKRRAKNGAATPTPVVVTPVATPEPPAAVAVPQLPAASESGVNVVDKAALKVA